ncbi:MAG: PspC domain-containing protein [Planctomycetota bacterium]|jgi:phage shock protein PspC (stress-responsive transcriptional regulator)
MTDTPRRLERTKDNMIAGVCGGLAKWYGLPAGRVRVAYVILSVLSAAFPGILVYLVLWFMMPEEP